nr:AAA family ATPase [Wenzhouxiangella sp. XN79A]
MYEQFYGLEERPFSITPDPRFVYLSQRHQDALAHLLYGIGRGGSGGFVQLTGEVGTGKTTLCRLLLEQVPEKTHIALVLNPMLEPRELLRAVCRELEVPLDDSDGSLEDLNERLNRRLLAIHADGERAVLIVDEAQNMSRETLEQVRLLTNLETATDKLLQIILLGQPELRELLSRPSLRQLAQRITARYHLAPLGQAETAEYVRHRIRIAGAARCPFTPAALRTLHHVSGGVPRLINIIADRALMAGYAEETDRISPKLVNRAAGEVVVGDEEGGRRRLTGTLSLVAVVLVLAVAAGMVWSLNRMPEPPADDPVPTWKPVLDAATARDAWRETAALWPDVDVELVRRACDEQFAEGLACHRLRGNLALIRTLGRPVVLRLTEPDDALVLLVALGERQLRIRQSGQEFRVPADAVEARWLGDFHVVWPDSGRVWRNGDVDPAIGEIKQAAAALADRPWTGAVGPDYDDEFETWVRGFQRRHGLRVDGMVGPVTRLYLTAPNDSAGGDA